ncbi:MAG: Trk system potassium transporter TrkA [Wenzhouxiangellaceae bacterium]|nr:Trk system potassium transporter TrkA [Wenzhouxiangellaceae bacterium]
MRIIILGAGQVGSGMAHSLSREENDISVVDTDARRLQELQDKLDIRTVLGHAAHPDTLIRAGIEDAEMLIALTNSDETNMVACQVAYSLFHTPTKVARVRAANYLAYPQLFERDHTPIDSLISPEQLVTDQVQRLIEYPGALQVLDFADGRAQLVAVRAVREGKLVGRALKSLPNELQPGADARVAAIFRGDQAIIPEGDTVIEVDDLAFFIAPTRETADVLTTFASSEAPAQRVVLAGGGNIGAALAHRLERKLHVKVIERNPERAEVIAEQLDTAIVLVGDAANEELLREEGIDETDVFCALTNEDEANILSSMLAKRMGAHKVITLINRPAYLDLVESDRIDVAVSPQQITIGALLTLIRKGHMVRVHSLRQGAAEAIEVIAHGDPGRSRIVGREIGAINMPESTSIGAVVRGNEVLIAHRTVVIEPEDHVIVFVADKKRIAEVERLFSVEAMFF